MIGNAVPVKFAEAIANKIMEDLKAVPLNKESTATWQTELTRRKEANLCRA
jgi:hypothetical protein